MASNTIVIHDGNYQDFIDPIVNGEVKKCGTIPRDYGTHPVCYSPRSKAFTMPLIPRNEWPERIKQGNANKTFMSNIRRTRGPNGGPIPSLDQNGKGYCWNHSAVMCNMLLRAAMNAPYKRLSAFFIGCIIKNYRDEGGWGAQALEFMCEHGVPDVEHWPEKSMSRSNDTPECRANAKLHIVTDFFVDMAAAVYDRNLSDDQAMTGLLTVNPEIGDFSFWGHSVALMDPVLMSESHPEIVMASPYRVGLMETDFDSLDLNNEKDAAIYGAAFGKKGINSWTDQWGDRGEFTLTGTKAILNGGAILVATMAS